MFYEWIEQQSSCDDVSQVKNTNSWHFTVLATNRKLFHTQQSEHGKQYITLTATNFYRAASNVDGLAMRLLSVRPSVRLSVKRVDCDKTE